MTDGNIFPSVMKSNKSSACHYSELTCRNLNNMLGKTDSSQYGSKGIKYWSRHGEKVKSTMGRQTWLELPVSSYLLPFPPLIFPKARVVSSAQFQRLCCKHPCSIDCCSATSFRSVPAKFPVHLVDLILPSLFFKRKGVNRIHNYLELGAMIVFVT